MPLPSAFVPSRWPEESELIRLLMPQTRAEKVWALALVAPTAALDLHQDNFIHGHVFYSYVFGDRTPYRPMQARSGALLPVLRSSLVDSGYEPGSEVYADAEGFIECHDGSITDHFHRAGVRYTAAIEMTTDTPADLAATVFRLAGINPAQEVRDMFGRPFRLNSGTPIAPLPSSWFP